MRIAVIGAGIIGVTTAYELSADGHEVTVLERRPSVAAEASFANAGVLASGYVAPWAAPGMPLKVLAGLWSRHSAVRFGASAWTATPWLWRYLLACRKVVHTHNRRSMQRLAGYSRERMDQLTADQQLHFEQTRGYLVLLRTPRELARAQRGLTLLTELGVVHDVLDAAACRVAEPGLAPDAPLHAGVQLPHDGVGNCRQFAHLIKAQAQARGARFRFEEEVVTLAGGTSPQIGVRATDTREPARSERFDAIVVCAGCEASHLLGPLGLRLPLMPVFGHSLTAPLRHVESAPDLGPRSGLMDERYKVAITRMGQRIRVAGGAEVGGRSGRIDPAALATLYKVLNDWFPGAAELARVQHWKGARPMLPDGPPVIGPSRTAGVWLNVGHGSSGWTLACGSARVLADQLAGRTPQIDTQGLAIDRLG